MKPFAHQAKELDEHWLSPARALLWQMRTGKTKAIIDQACLLYSASEIDAVIVVAPNGVHSNWCAKQLPLHSTVSYQAYAWRSSDTDRLINVYALGCAFGLSWLTINMEALIRDDAIKAITKFRQGRNFMLVIDESHHFASPGSKRTGKARGLAKYARYRRILTGTAIENSPLQAYSQFQILEPGALGCKTYAEFKRRYAIFGTGYRGSRQYEVIEGYKNLPELRERMAPYASVVLRKDCEDLPPVQIDSRIVELTDEQREYFKALRDEDLNRLVDWGFKEPPAGGALLTKLQQIECGFLNTPGGQIRFQTGKFSVVLDEIEDHQCLIWCNYTHEILTLTKALGAKAECFYGATSQLERTAILQRFQTGKIQVLIAQPKAAGEGYDLSAADKILWHSQTPDAIVRAQANERATISGGKSKQIVDIYSLRGTDDYFLSLTNNKTALADDIARYGLQDRIRGLQP